MYLNTPPETPEVQRFLQKDKDSDGFVMNLSRLWAWRPEVCEGFQALRNQLTSNSTLSKREVITIVCVAASSLGDSYCSLAWGQKLVASAGAATTAAVLQGGASPDMTPRETALAAWVRKVVKGSNATRAADVAELREAGFSDREIFEITAFAAFRIAFSTVNSALGVPPDWELADAMPAQVLEAITYGRPVAPRPA